VNYVDDYVQKFRETKPYLYIVFGDEEFTTVVYGNFHGNYAPIRNDDIKKSSLKIEFMDSSDGNHYENKYMTEGYPKAFAS